MSLPIIHNEEMLIRTLEQWRQRLNKTIKRVPRLRPPFNFRTLGGAAGSTGVSLQWTAVTGADGYEIQRASTRDFSDTGTITSFTVENGAQEAFFDSLGATTVARFYRIASLSGTTSEPHSVRGQFSAVIGGTSGSTATTYDNVTSTTGDEGWSNRAGFEVL